MCIQRAHNSSLFANAVMDLVDNAIDSRFKDSREAWSP